MNSSNNLIKIKKGSTLSKCYAGLQIDPSIKDIELVIGNMKQITVKLQLK